MPAPSIDPYQLRPEAVEEPPRTWPGVFRRIGPGLILAGAVVGSGELVATTVLGAENGYSLLWLILLSCAIKVVVQNELGRYAIGSGETTLEALNRIPGPRWGVSWVVWLWLLMVAAVLFAVGGMLGAIGEVLNTIVPAISVDAWMWIVTALTAVLLWFGRYGVIEKTSVILVACFTLLTLSAAYVLTRRPEFFSWAGVADGLSFHLPQGGLSTAVTVFGGTGVGSGELIMYPYWCIEKGYARFTGPRDGSPSWTARARGWIRVIGVDVLNSLVVYTFATVAFYLLGAGVLHAMGIVPQGAETVRVLSNMYTETLGGWSRNWFLLGAVIVMYSTVFAVTAAHTRLFADFLGMSGAYDRKSFARRTKVMRGGVIGFLLVPCLTFLFLREPVVMVKVSGIAQAILLPVIGFSTVFLRYRHLPREVAPKGWMTLALWVTSAIMAALMGASLALQFME